MVLKITNLHILRYLPTYWLYLLERYTIDNQQCTHTVSGNESLIQIAQLPFTVALLNYAFALPGYVYMNAVTGTGATRTTFIVQTVTIIAYQIYLWTISNFSTSLSVYWTAEYLYVILLGVLSIIYLKSLLSTKKGRG